MLFKRNITSEEEKEIVKYYFENDEVKIRSDYGLDEFFSLADQDKPQKFISFIYDDKYVLNMFDTRADHIGLIDEIRTKFGEQRSFIGGTANYISIQLNDDVTKNQINIVLGILREIKSYYERTGNEKKINISLVGSKIFDNMRGTKDLNLMIEALENIKNQLKLNKR